MNIETFWKIINKVDILGNRKTGEATQNAVTELKKYSEKDIKIFALIFYEYFDFLFEKYRIAEFDALSNDFFTFYYLPTFIIALGYPAYKYFYQLRLSNVKKVNTLLDILYKKMMFQGEEHPHTPYSFSELEEIISKAYEEKFSKDMVLDFKLTKEQEKEIQQSLMK